MTIAMRKPLIRLLYDNYTIDDRIKPDWGLSLMLEWPDFRLLFDSGADGELLLNNMNIMGIDPASLNAVFISHNHWDHQGGLDALLEKNPRLEVFIHSRFAESFVLDLRRKCAKLRIVEEAGEILPGIFSSGPLEAPMPEHSLIVPCHDETLLLAGCAHPGLENILDAACVFAPDKNFHVVGGLHMKGFSRIRIHESVKMLTARGVTKIAPCHCSGDEAREILHDFWLEDCTLSGAGGNL